MKTTDAITAHAGRSGQKTSMQVLTLSLQGETYAIEARHVREILDPVPVTDVPGAPRELNGLINVRGKVVPLLDLCLKLGMKPSPRSIDTRFIVVEAPIAGVNLIVGLRADRVYEMAEFSADALEETPQIGMRVRGSFVRCIAKRAGEFVVVLDLEAILRIDADPPNVIRGPNRERFDVSLSCSIDIGNQTVQARVVNLSAAGALVRGFPSQPQGSLGQIRIEGLPDTLNFRVVECRDGDLRMEFDAGAPPSLVALVQRLEEANGEAPQTMPSRQDHAQHAMEKKIGYAA